MAKSCPICEKGPRMGGTRKLLRGHYNPVNWKRKQANLQWAPLPDGGRVKICTRCLKKNLQLTSKKKVAKKKISPIVKTKTATK